MFTAAAQYGGSPSLAFIILVIGALGNLASPTFAQTDPPPTAPGAPLSIDDIVRRANPLLDELEDRETQEPDSNLLDQVKAMLDRAVKQEPDSSWIDYLYGRFYAVTQRPGEAIDRLRRFVDTPQGQNDWVSYRLLGDLFLSEFPRLAQSNYMKASQLNAGEPSIVLGLSRCAARLGDFDTAEELGRQAVDLAGNRHPRYRSNLALIYSSQKRWDDAMKAAEPALKLARDRLAADSGNLNRLQSVERQYRVLSSILNARINQGENLMNLYAKLARVIHEKAEIDWRISLHSELFALEKAVGDKVENAPPEVLQRYGIVLAAVGRKEQAIDAFNTLLGKDPENPVATEWLQRLRSSDGALSPPPPSPAAPDR